MLHFLTPLVTMIHIMVCTHFLKSDLHQAAYYGINIILGLCIFWITEKQRRVSRLKNCGQIDTEYFPNHWFFGGAFDAPDPNTPGEHRHWEMKLLRLQRAKRPDVKVFYVMLGITPFVFLADESSFESILSSTKHIEKNFGYGFLIPWIGEGILISGGQKWKTRRRLLNASFHYKILENYCEMMTDTVNDFVAKLKAHVSLGAKAVDFYDEMNALALQIICRTAMGHKLSFEDKGAQQYRQDVESIKKTLRVRANNPVLWTKIIYDLSPFGWQQQKLIRRMHKFTEKIIERRIADFRQMSAEEITDMAENYGRGKVKRQMAFLDTLIYSMDIAKEIDLQAVREEMEVFMFAGHDTTTAAGSFGINFITEDRRVLAKCLSELDEVFGDSDRSPNFEDLKKMKYLEACIKETLRLRSPVREYFRCLPEGGIIPVDGVDYHIVPGATILIVIDMVHHDGKHFEKPFEFRPERFTGDSKRHPYSYVPFSAGPRNCIGQNFGMMELKLVLSALLRNFSFEPCSPTNDITISSDIVSAPFPYVKIKTNLRE